MDPYPREVVDAKFETLRQEIRADANASSAQLRGDVAQLRLDMQVGLTAVKEQTTAGDTSLKEVVAGLNTRLDVLAGQIKVWGFVLGILMPVLLLVINKLWK